MGLHEEIREAELLVYGRACPNCGGFISDKRLGLGIPCSSCLPEIPRDLSLENIFMMLKRSRRLKRFKELYDFSKTYNDLVNFFIKCVGNEPWSIQKLWLKRVAKNASFAMIAPTGVGKTTFGVVVALYLAMKGFKSYIIVPTTTLAMQLEKKIEELSSRADIIVRYVVIHSKLKRGEKRAREAKLLEPDGFDILVTTSNYLLRNSDKVLKHDFKFIFVDDVDAVLRGSRAIDIILKLAGYDDNDIEKALRVIKLKRELAYRGEDPELLERIRSIESELEIKRRRLGKVVIIASATGNPRGTRVKLFKELMGFEIGARPEFIRNIVDAYERLRSEDVIEQLASLVRRLGYGGLIYVPIDKGIEYAEYLASKLRERGVKAQAMHSKNIKAIEEFIAGELEVLVGVATYYGVLVRGIDLPETIRYAIFVGIPRHKIALRLKEVKAQDILRLLPIVRDVVSDDELRRKIEGYIARMRRLIRRAGGYVIERLNQILSGEKPPETRGEKEFLEIYNLIKELTQRREIIEAMKKHPEVSIIEEDGELYVLIPDAPTYIQASGRTSRLFLGGISKGLSIVLVDDDKLVKGLERRLRWIIEEFTFTPLNEVNVDELIREIDKDRELIKKLRAGEVPEEIKVRKKGLLDLKTALLIVESPNKARTIARFFGRPSTREYGKLRVYEVNLGNYTLLITASGGHIYDLIQDVPYPGINHIYGVTLIKEGTDQRFIPIYTTLKRCLDKGHQFALEAREGEQLRCPSCGSTNIYDAVNAVEAIRDVAMEVDEILVGTDPDTEGEKIAFDIINVILPYNKSVKRVEFHEVTRRAIINAVNNPRSINLDLVKAQLIRRIEDRWIGFSLSKQLQTEFWQQFCKNLGLIKEQYKIKDKTVSKYEVLCRKYVGEYRNLSAGRVQTPVLGWVIEAYEEHKATRRKYLSAVLEGNRLEVAIPRDLAREVTPKNVEEVRVTVKDLSVTEEELNPLPPYTTDAALSDINSKLGLPAPKAMAILQDLFELGFITYHRTDSTRISDVGMNVAKEYMKEVFGDKYVEYYQPRRWGEGGAHEGIRPTRPIDTQTLRKLIADGIIEPVRRLTKYHFSVYDLIFRRFMASQAKPAKVRKQIGKVAIEVITKDGKSYSLGEVDVEVYIDVLHDGFLKFYSYIRVSKPLTPGTYILTKEFRIYDRSEKPLHTEASLVRLMKEREIGRPSTYAKIIDTLFKRRYVMHIRKGEGIVPSLLGRVVYDYLVRQYGRLVSEERTRLLERKMKEVEEGKARYSDIIKELFEELESEVGIPGVRS